MGGVNTVERPSLERLKALDSLPDLPTQLAEANRLCNHPARADMIAKWLLDKLKKSSELRSHLGAWNLLSSTVRLLSPERSASLLSSSNIIDAVLAATEESKSSEVLFNSIASLFELLLEISAGPNGTSIKALLSLPSLQAARILGMWLRNAAQKSTATIHLGGSHDVSLQTELAIWSLRKTSIDENEHFASHCLIPAALLLSRLSPEDTERAKTVKRVLGNVDKPRDSLVKELETLLARHIFLPSRTAFHRAQSASSDPTASLKALLGPLKSSNEGAQSHLQAIPSLLDIALRCVSTPTQRQRTKEKPWVEALFEALNGCNKGLESGRADLSILVKMLQVVANRAALSPETLKKIVWDYSVLSISRDADDWLERCSAEHWMIISQVVKMESDIFTQRNLAEVLFTCVSKAVKTDVAKFAEKSSHFADPKSVDTEIKRWRIQWLEEILVPTLKAFAKRRDLRTFIDLWSRQLKEEKREQAWSTWVDLDAYLHAELENSLTETQILDMFESFSSTVTRTQNGDTAETAPISTDNIASSIVILNGILGSFRSESLANALALRCENLFNRLLTLFTSPTEAQGDTGFALTRPRRIWLLLLKTFELWFPVWLARQHEPELKSRNCTWLLAHPVAIAALETFQDRVALLDDRAIPANNMEAVDAECFIGSICHHIVPYETVLEPEIRDRLRETLSSLVWRVDACHSEALCLYPDLFESIQDPQGLKTRGHVLSRYFGFASSSLEGHTALSTWKALRAITAIAVRYAESAVLDDIVRIALDWIHGFRSGDETMAVDLLHEIPVGSLSRLQRERILNALCENKTQHGRQEQETLRKFLALMVKLMEVPNASSRLSTDHSVIWNVVLEATVTDYVRSKEDWEEKSGHKFNDSETLTLIEELARLLVKHLLSTQDQDRDHSTLLQLSADAKTVLEFCCSQQDIHDRATAVALSKAIIEGLEIGAKDSLKKQLPHRDAETMNVVLQSLYQEIKTMVPKVEGGQVEFDYRKATSVCILLETLAIVLKLVPSNAGSAASDLTGNIAEDLSLATDSFYELHNMLQKHSVPAFRSILIRCFTICCEYRPLNTSLSSASFASKLLDMQPTASETKSVLDVFEDLVRRLDRESRLRLTEHTFASLDSTQHSSLPLVQICLTKLEKGDISEDSGWSPYQILPKLLQVARTSLDISSQDRAMSSILVTLRQKPFLNNQYTVDTTLMSLPKFFERSPSGSLNFLDVCRVVSALLLNHRARLQGRFHLVNSIYQKLISNLFTPHKDSSSDQKISKPLGPEHANALSRAIILFCEPLLLRRQANATSLTDESRKEQAHVGRFVQNVLHHYCSQILSGTLADGVADALKPGLRSMIEAIEMNDADGIKHLSASMSNSERAVLRGIYDDWRRFGKWRGG